MTHFSRPTTLNRVVHIRLSTRNLLNVTFELDTSDEGNPLGHLTFVLAPRVHGIDSQPLRDSQENSAIFTFAYNNIQVLK